MGTSRLNVAFVTDRDPADVKTWSGTFHYAAQALIAQSIAIDQIGPLERRYETPFKAKEAFFRYVLRRRHPREREPLIARHFARQVMSKLRPEHDLVFGVGTLALAYLECDQPIVAWTDATFARIVDFYPAYTNLSAAAIRNGNALEEAALKRCQLAIYASDWAAESAVQDYGLEPERVAVVPFGPNMEIDLSLEDAAAAVAARSPSTCQLLFIGAEWERKGGSRAIEVAAELNAAGLKTQLDLVGSTPPARSLPAFVTHHGFIDKSTATGQETLRRLLLESHFLLLPARAECFGVVLCEASAHAVPSLSTRVGGIPTAVRDDVNGKLFARDAGPKDYSGYILELFGEPDRYRQLALSSFEEYRSRLNWTVAGATVRRLLERAVESA